MTLLLTGAAGFIGFHVAEAFLGQGRQVIGIDNLNDYYDPGLKEARLNVLRNHAGFRFERLDISDDDAVENLTSRFPDVTHVVHLAAQAGVRYSLENPFAYVAANVKGQLAMLEAARRWPKLEHFVYASSSSVYGANEKTPFSVSDPVEKPVSLYAATKRSGELIAESYARLYGNPMTGLRFFTVYGPWGRPDMAYFIFTEAIMQEREIKVFNEGRMRRDFTYIDDIVGGVVAATERVPEGDPAHKIYNLGNSRSEELGRVIEILESACGKQARKRYLGMQPGDVVETFADIEDSRRDLGFDPKTPIDEGLPQFVNWYRQYRST